VEIVRTRAEARAAMTAAARPAGVVLTMGALHEGHASLFARARNENATVAATIFVNPRQFNDASDFAAYPRDEARDLELARTAGVDVLWLPPPDAVFPAGFDTTVSVGAVAAPLEGTARPGHFDGVATVVAILLTVLGGDRTYFGQKDAQQVAVVRRMVADLGIGTEVVACPTIREPDGLALSSRNVRLTPAERAAAPVLARALSAARERWTAGETSAATLRATMRDVIDREPLAAAEYASVADAGTLRELETAEPGTLLSVAVRFGDVRLIDNVVLGGDVVPGGDGAPP
jgi:pantoate--beta-alanine ligase